MGSSTKSLPVNTLPVVEHWDCTGCGKCCRGNQVPLSDQDLQRIRQQRWDRHPDFRGERTVVRQGLLSRRYRLAQRGDGTCVFLGEDGLCQIHKEFGFDAKPLVCRMYPLQIIPLEKSAVLTLRRSCPTAAADNGRPLDEHRAAAKAFVKERPRLAAATQPPAIRRGHRTDWTDALAVTDAIGRLLSDERFPLVRRLAHGLSFCNILENARLRRLDSERLRELTSVLEQAAPDEAAPWFQDPSPPSRTAGIQFRQTVVEYLRLHGSYAAHESLQQRLRMAIVAWSFAAGKGDIPLLHSSFPKRSFAEVEDRRLGHLDQAVQQPLLRYFETNALSKQYAIAGRPGWSIIERYRALALAFPVAMWMLRYFAAEGPPQVSQIIEIITAIDRGQGYAPLGGRQYRWRVSQLARLDQLPRLVVWYAK